MLNAQEMLGESGPKAPGDARRSKRLPGTQGQPGPRAEHRVGSSRRDRGDKGVVTTSGALLGQPWGKCSWQGVSPLVLHGTWLSIWKTIPRAWDPFSSV